ncbi:nicotinate-nucleotide pyrophosphorylase [carboxylating] [Thiogranum longum]|uniref:Probable nicotinate-nucleotide pyrophosphorylase [carboxylating] n=1 Tax=Thiogranum longum TaxID=1537524 RepID=A0A4R1HFV3_9GAMM|nr:carboxylating nicotinate-nucleotide diphosphorylase [Thiogranum longum]TCK19130.1 nicotinate-nucleotide pyrophosphorylase [carboxylating] [Thiogranum longum]
MLLEVLEAHIDEDVHHALEEDVGQGDITAQLVPADGIWKASVYSREHAILCGRNWFDAVFRQLDEKVDLRWYAADGDSMAPHQVVCTLKGPARSLLTGERTALNFLQTLSGTATLAHQYAKQVEGLSTRILDTRKTIPGLRRAQKYAVRTGGCHNHRMGLYDAFLIKENHIAAAGSISAAVRNARNLDAELPVEVEVENMDELQQALQTGVKRIMLDNFSLENIGAAVALNDGKAELEASGGITLDNLRQYAETGVDYISTGALTKDVKAIDLSMRFD